jgi:hypothetical protein
MKVNKKAIQKLIDEYTTVVKIVDKDAQSNQERAYGGVIRSVKGKLQEHLTEEIIKLAWKSLGGSEERLEINSNKIDIPILKEYVDGIKDDEIKNYILSNLLDYTYKLSVDKHIFIDGKFVLGIECKAYTENAMLKRILVDFRLLKTQFPNLKCYHFQLESQLGGDYSELNNKTYGSPSTHTLLSYFKDVDLKIFTFLKGERMVDKPIHKHFKPLEFMQVKKAIELIASELKEYV